MKPPEGANLPDEHAGVRQQLIHLIRARRLRYGVPPKRPARRTFKFRLASSQPVVYVKLQIIGSHVVLRSFHYSEDDRHA